MGQNAQEIIDFIGNASKKTPVKVYLKGDLQNLSVPDSIQAFLDERVGILFGDWHEVEPFLKSNADLISAYHIENEARNSAVPLLDFKKINARIEPGAIIRDQVKIGTQAVIMMGAVINIGAEIGANSMIDMGAVVGGRAIVGQNVHLGANAVLAGVIEPASAKPVTIGDNVLIGANAVVLEGVQVGNNAVIGAGAVVTEDVAPNTVVAGVPAKVIKQVDAETKSKTGLESKLRKL
ncbi:2,3,4,5-tetrahydropyridine-2,6-dicarboxylate N-acetyltransferase [Lactobacillus sp. ESL0791]|uniref:2,3,4,5-tetrahydropyridine-2,6-dicarboxylate N-acetyltransferase n=1 Tax=Lactobacillus sp. ESL0791 TaxID=2983234 RepID=UPI0023FA41E1|nr:2,3,4,5-tetrahydropyridine-2,6-dicarboxylate N-acetyltransferase [Lactobacillus sp. ESL0791]MDF7638064.1 2,3,4,5-tetrahydropyridine-2,6-dicarboxylate N-acetyltransferase [Lactobacillus sp. ESL0791]